MNCNDLNYELSKQFSHTSPEGKSNGKQFGQNLGEWFENPNVFQGLFYFKHSEIFVDSIYIDKTIALPITSRTGLLKPIQLTIAIFVVYWQSSYLVFLLQQADLSDGITKTKQIIWNGLEQ